MAINQLSTSNTFSQWLTATQALITNYNQLENVSNVVIATGNNVTNLYSEIVVANTNAQIANVNAQIANTYAQEAIIANTNAQIANANAQIANVNVQIANTYSQEAILANTNAQIANTNAWQARADALEANTIIRNYVSTAFDQANLAFDQANLAFDLSNTANITANAAYYLATNATGQVIPSQVNNGGKYLSTDGAVLVWNTLDSLPSQSGNDGKFLTTNGAVATWANITSGGSTSSVPDTLSVRDSNADLYANNFISTSDARLKESVRPIENALSIIQQMRGVKFKWKATNAEQIGLIAQEVEKVLPHVVFGNDMKSVNYGVIVSVLIEAVKELSNRLDKMEK